LKILNFELGIGLRHCEALLVKYIEKIIQSLDTNKTRKRRGNLNLQIATSELLNNHNREHSTHSAVPGRRYCFRETLS
jgi:hypothetical protein